MNRQKRTHKNP